MLARERQIFGGILPTRRTGRSVEQLIVSRTERTSSPTSDLRHVARRLDSFVSRSRGKRSLSSAVEDYRRSRPVDRTYTCQGWVWRTRSDFVLCGSGDSGRGVRLKLAGLAEAHCASSPPRVEGAVALDQGVEIARPHFKNCVNTEAETSMACFFWLAPSIQSASVPIVRPPFIATAAFNVG